MLEKLDEHVRRWRRWLQHRRDVESGAAARHNARWSERRRALGKDRVVTHRPSWEEAAQRREAARLRMKERCRQYYQRDKERLLAAQKVYKASRKEESAQVARRRIERLRAEWAQQHPGLLPPGKPLQHDHHIIAWARYSQLDQHVQDWKAERQRIAAREWARAHPEVKRAKKCKERQKIRLNPNLKIRLQLGKYLSTTSAAIRDGRDRMILCSNHFGFSQEDLRAHLEALFQPGMSWDSYGGRDGWQVDHIVPQASFDLTDPAQRAACYALSNLRPLTAKENRRRNRSYMGGEIVVRESPRTRVEREMGIAAPADLRTA